MTIRVLVVDDHTILRAGLAALLTATGDIELVGEAAGGEEAVRLAAELRPDVILMDLSMPGMDGVTATRKIVAKHPGTHVIVLTSYTDQQWISDALEAGAEGYLLKHSGPEVVTAGIREVMAGGAPLDPKAARILISSRQVRPAPSTALTKREGEVLDLVRSGLSNRAIARQLKISERTVKAHLTNIFQRIGVQDRMQAALWAQRNREKQS
ncbi:MAG TPA: response regulator transcription factor [Microlunatus sp.]|nr:response regulator transcription factor [Microlunatus sp.]